MDQWLSKLFESSGLSRHRSIECSSVSGCPQNHAFADRGFGGNPSPAPLGGRPDARPAPDLLLEGISYETAGKGGSFFRLQLELFYLQLSFLLTVCLGAD